MARRMAGGLARFGAALLVLIGGCAAGYALVFDSPAERQALVVSAALAFGVQLLCFAVMLRAGARALFTARVFGMLIRLVALILYALVVVKGFALAPAAALISLATFFFLATLLEPVFLKP